MQKIQTKELTDIILLMLHSPLFPHPKSLRWETHLIKNTWHQFVRQGEARLVALFQNDWLSKSASFFPCFFLIELMLSLRSSAETFVIIYFFMTPVHWSRKTTVLWKCPEENAERWITITKWRLQNACLKISHKKHISTRSLFCWKLLRTQKPENRCCKTTHSMRFGIMSTLIAFQEKRSARLQRERSRWSFFCWYETLNFYNEHRALLVFWMVKVNRSGVIIILMLLLWWQKACSSYWNKM